MRENFINRATAFLGCKEADGSHKQIIDIYNSIQPLPRGYRLTYSDPWCAAFVSAAGKDFGEIIPECSCDGMIRAYKQQGKWQGSGYAPQTGDLVFYNWDKNSTADHVGIVVNQSGDMLKVIEGNISDSVAYRAISRLSSQIFGFATPFAKTMATAPPQSGGGEINIQLPLLSTGHRSHSVTALQHLLIGNGFSCGTYGADGDFGIKTREALLSYQRSKNLHPDGICGKQSWSALLL